MIAENEFDADEFDFEESLDRVEKLLGMIEDGGCSLEQSLKAYESGVRLIRLCLARLDRAEQTIRQITGLDADGGPVLAPFDHSASAAPVAAPGRPRPRSPRVE